MPRLRKPKRHFLAGLLGGIILALLPPLFVDIGNLSLANVAWIALTVFTLHIVALNVLYPKFLGSRLRLNPLAVTIALLVWAWLWGAIGGAVVVVGVGLGVGLGLGLHSSPSDPMPSLGTVNY